MEKKTVLENLDLVLLSVDEIIDGGWVPSALHNIFCNALSDLIMLGPHSCYWGA